MTVKEMMEMLKKMNENAEVAFVVEATDRDGFTYQKKVTAFEGVVEATAEPVKKLYGNPFYLE